MIALASTGSDPTSELWGRLARIDAAFELGEPAVLRDNVARLEGTRSLASAKIASECRASGHTTAWEDQEMASREPVSWAPGLWLLSDVHAAAWVEAALARTPSGTVAAMVPPVFTAYARVLPPTYADDGTGRHRWSEIAASRGMVLTEETWFDALVVGSDRWGRPSDGGLDARETQILADVLSPFTDTPDEAYFCLWEGFGLDETQAWWNRPVRVRTPHRAYHLLTGPVAAASVLPTPVEWRCASLWWPADRAWLVATEIDGYLTYVGASQAAIEAVLAHPALDAVRVRPETPLDPSNG